MLAKALCQLMSQIMSFLSFLSCFTVVILVVRSCLNAVCLPHQRAGGRDHPSGDQETVRNEGVEPPPASPNLKTLTSVHLSSSQFNLDVEQKSATLQLLPFFTGLTSPFSHRYYVFSSSSRLRQCGLPSRCLGFW